MTAELISKLLSRLNGNGNLTPTQIQRSLDKAQTVSKLDIWLKADLPPIIADIFIARKGSVDGERLKRFNVSLKRVRECYGEMALSALTPKCIRKNGSINVGRFRKNLKAQQSLK